MAHGESLRLREIQPREGQARSAAEPNPWRRWTSAEAKSLRVSRRRVVRRVAAAWGGLRR